jgi:EF hand
MNIARTFLFGVAALAFAASGAYADTRSADGDKGTMEHKASPSNPTKQDEEQAEAHSRPDSPHPQGKAAQGNTSGGASKSPKKSGKKSDQGKEKSSSGASSPSSAAEPMGVDEERAFKLLDLDGDGAISKAEAAGNAALITAFDRADRNHDGKLSPAEYASIGKLRERRGAKAASR